MIRLNGEKMAAKTDRNDRGQFLPGHSGGPGRPPRAVESDYLRVLAATVTVDHWQRICQRALDDALAGDAKARSWLASYLLPSGSDLAAAYADLDTDFDAVAAEIRQREMTAIFDFNFS